MWCLVSQPNSVILEVEVDPKAKGQECLEKVCQCLGISNETDYFGLKYHSTKGEELWLNLRNPIERQVTGAPPHRLALRVKFWVPPHLLLQETTRHQFYLHARLDLLEGRLRASDWGLAARLLALVTQADCGDYEPLSPPPSACDLAVEGKEPRPADFQLSVASHLATVKGMKTSAAEYWLLKEVSYMDDFGEEVFQSKTGGEAGGPGLGLGVGPHGVMLHHLDQAKQTIPYTAIQSAASCRRMFHLVYLDGSGEEQVFSMKLDTSQAANGLYRAITEKHAFYSCETVRSAVTTQFIRDLKGTIVSIFNEDTSLGKKYVFDIRRTCREVYDNARRALYQPSSVHVLPVDVSGSSAEISECSHCGDGQCQSKQKLSNFMEAMSCRICMDRTIDTAFFPCAHMMTCSDCAARCERCPLCRSLIQNSCRIFLPIDMQHYQDGDASTRQG